MMKRLSRTSFPALPIIIILVWMILTPSRAAACSVAVPPFESYVQESTVVAIGTISAATVDTVTMDVESYFKGSVRTPHLVINNHRVELSASCIQSQGSGSRLSASTRVLAFLTPDHLGNQANWLPTGHLGEGIFIIDGDRIRSIELPSDVDSLSIAQERITKLTGPPMRPDANAQPSPPLPVPDSFDVFKIGNFILLVCALCLTGWYLRNGIARRH